VEIKARAEKLCLELVRIRAELLEWKTEELAGCDREDQELKTRRAEVLAADHTWCEATPCLRVLG
jgi:hypothetical protein